MNEVIAGYLGCTEGQITEVHEWAYVYFVRMGDGFRSRFVSKKAVAAYKAHCEAVADWRTSYAHKGSYQGLDKNYGACMAWNGKAARENNARLEKIWNAPKPASHPGLAFLPC